MKKTSIKLERLVCCAFAIAVWAGCSNEYDSISKVKNASPAGSGEAYLALSLSMPESLHSRAGGTSTEDGGTSEESGIKNAMVVLFNDSVSDAEVVNVLDLTFDNAPVTVANLTSDAFPVDSAAKFILVIVNPIEIFKARIVKGAKLASVNETYELADDVIASMSKYGAFFMNNLELKNCSDFIVKYPTASTTDKLKGLAMSRPVVVSVDRAVAKVTLSAAELLSNENAEISLEEWRVNVTNRKFILLPDSVKLPGSLAMYYKDANYSNNLSLGADYFKEFKIDNDFVAFKATTQEKKEVTTLYCPENTMQAEDQKYAYTTQVVLKVKYLPKKDVLGSAITGSWFEFEGTAYSYAQLKAAYDHDPEDKDLKDACDAFARSLDETQTFDQLQENTLNESTASKVGDVGINYYHDGYCYYKVMIRHDQDNNQPMSLGRYGVVRNNWYNLNVKSISQPGLPYPKDPVANPDGTASGLDTTDDDLQNYVSVSIEVKPWTSWKQEVEL